MALLPACHELTVGLETAQPFRLLVLRPLLATWRRTAEVAGNTQVSVSLGEPQAAS